MAQRFLSDVHATAGLKDSSGDLGSDGQVLSSTGSNTNWVNPTIGTTVIYKDTFYDSNAATDGQTVFTLANTVDSEDKTQVYIDGAYQSKIGYTVSGTTLTFDTGLAEYSEVEVITFSTATANNAASAVKLDTFDSEPNGTLLTFVLDEAVVDEKVTQVYINGVYQEKSTYSIDSDLVTLRFEAGNAPPNNSTVEVISFKTITSTDGTLTATTFLGDLNGTINTATTATTQSAGNDEDLVATTAFVKAAADAKVAEAITNGTTGIAPSQDVVFDALALKSNIASPTFTGDTGAANLTLSGYLRGPASFTIDPATHGDITGTVFIAGNLQVDGTHTTINSTTVSIDDLVFSIATDALDSAAADGAGITIGGAGASLTYSHSGTKFVLNKPLDVTGAGTFSGSLYLNDNIYHNGDTNTSINFQSDRQTFLAGGFEFVDFRKTTQSYLTLGNSSDTDTRIQGGSGSIFIQGSNGYIGINDNSPSYPLEINANTYIGATLETSSTATFGGNVGIGVAAGSETLKINQTTGNQSALYAYTTGVTTGQSYGGTIQAGTNASDASFRVFAQGGGTSYFYVRGDGNVGIGTNSPSEAIEVKGNDKRISVRTQSGEGGFRWKNDAGTNMWDFVHNNSTGSLHLKLITNSTIPLTVKYPSGDVGIGASSPSAKLHIVGDNTARNTLKNILIIDGGAQQSNPYGPFAMGIKFIGRDYGNAIRDYGYITSRQSDHTSNAGGGDPGFTSTLDFYTNSGGASSTLPTRKMVITPSGAVTKPLQPSWCLRPNGGGNANISSATFVGWSDNTSGSSSKAVFKNNVTLNGSTGGIHGAASTGRLTVPVAGKYQIYTTVRMENSPIAGNIYLHVNGTIVARQHVEVWGRYNYAHGFLSLVLNLSANDYIEVQLVCNTGIVAGYNDTVNWFSGHLIG